MDKYKHRLGKVGRYNKLVAQSTGNPLIATWCINKCGKELGNPECTKSALPPPPKKKKLYLYHFFKGTNSLQKTFGICRVYYKF